jgi:hypothetical protein
VTTFLAPPADPAYFAGQEYSFGQKATEAATTKPFLEVLKLE